MANCDTPKCNRKTSFNYNLGFRKDKKLSLWLCRECNYLLLGEMLKQYFLEKAMEREE